MELLEAIIARRSIRKFKPQDVPEELLKQVLEAGRWAPSGMNNQPWRFIVVKDIKLKKRLSEFTVYSKVINNAPCIIAVFLDSDSVYNRDKDMQAIGACIQNMLLAIFGLGLGACWLGEILNKKDKVSLLLGAPAVYELAAVIALGFADEMPSRTMRKKLADLIFKEYKLCEK